MYTLRRATEFELAEVDALETGNRWTLYAITGLFCYLLVSVISLWLLIEILPYSGSQTFFRANFVTHRTIFGYVVPLVVVVAMGLIGWRKIVPSIRQARDIEVSIVPKEIDVFHEFDSTRPLHVNIENETSDEIEFTTIIRFPEDVEWRYRGTNQGQGTFTDEITVPPQGHEPLNIELRYQGTERKSAEVNVLIAKGADTYTDNMLLTLEEY